MRHAPRTGHRPVAGHPLFSRKASAFSEFTRQVGRDAEVDLVGCSAIEDTMGHYRVVLLDVEGDKTLNRRG